MYWRVLKTNFKESVSRERKDRGNICTAAALGNTSAARDPRLQVWQAWGSLHPLSTHCRRALRQAMPPPLHCTALPLWGPGTSLSWAPASSPAPFYIQLICLRGGLAFSLFASQGASTSFSPENEAKLDCAFCFLIHNPQYFLSTFSSTSVSIIKNSQKTQTLLLNSNLGLARKLCQLWLSS